MITNENNFCTVRKNGNEEVPFLLDMVCKLGQGAKTRILVEKRRGIIDEVSWAVRKTPYQITEKGDPYSQRNL